MLNIALSWNKQGYATIPIKYRDKKPNLPSWEEYKTRLPTHTELQTWFATGLHNIGLIVGWHNLCVIDFDSMTEYARWMAWTNRIGGYTEYAAASTYQVKTNRGIHVYVTLPHLEINRKLAGVDIKARAGYVLIPPSIHPSGAEYKPINRNPIMMITALSDILPADLLTAVPAPVSTTPVAAPPILSVKQSDVWDHIDQLPNSTDFVGAIRARFSLMDFLPDAERSSASGRWWVVKCPFHDDKNPSFWIDVQRGICGCHAGCTPKPLDVIDLYGRLYGLSNRDAIFAMMKRL